MMPPIIDIGRKLDSSVFAPFPIYIGVILASFQSFGSTPLLSDIFNNLVTDGASSATGGGSISNTSKWLSSDRDSIWSSTHGTLIGCNEKESWWCHQMETFSALLAVCAGNSPVASDFPHKGQWCWALMFSLICVWINGWVNNCETGDLRRYHAHYDVIAMMNTFGVHLDQPSQGFCDTTADISKVFIQCITSKHRGTTISFFLSPKIRLNSFHSFLGSFTYFVGKGSK